MLSSAPDAQSVASSATETAPLVETAVDQAVANRDQVAFREAVRAERAGKPLDVHADPSPASDEQTADPSPAAADQKPRVDRRATEHRIPELLTERAQLRAELDQARRDLLALKQPPKTDDKQADPSPAAVTADFPEFDAWLAKPENEGKTYTQYQVYLTKAIYAQAQVETREQDAKAREQREHDDRIVAYRKSATTFIADHPDYWDVVTPLDHTPRSAVTDALIDVIERSENPPALLYELGQSLETWQRLISLPERSALVELGKIAGALTAPEKPKTQPLTKASEPGTILGRKTVDPADAIDAAVASGDVARFRAEKLKQRAASYAR